MLYTIGRVGDCELSTSSHPVLSCHGEKGCLTIALHGKGILYVSYAFDGLESEKCMLDAHEFLKGNPPPYSGVPSLVQDEKSATLQAGRLSVVVNKAQGNITVVRDGVVLSGGELGTMDTVIPRIQARAFRNKDDASWFARFNFPLEEHDRFFGLGDKGGEPDRRGRRLRMYNRDSLGYDAEKSDPLYKSIPFYLKQNPEKKTICGFYFPVPLLNAFDFGEESPFYSYVEVSGGPVCYYMFTGDSYRAILDEYCSVTGYPALPPLFSFGFFGSSMNYVESDDAMNRILGYFDHVEKERIPCEGMYVSSGYLKADDGHRYAFFWNKRKFPEYGKFLFELRRRGYNLCMNIKPGILTTHPWYEELKRKGYFLKDGNGEPLVEFYWGGEASFIDFSNPDAKAWWKAELKDKYLAHGCTGIWNDNNECELEDEDSDAFKTRTLFPVRMCEAAYEACNEFAPGKRHWIYSRSGYAGLQKYARTWSGDNTSTWKTLKFNQYQGLSMGLSALPFFGHDLGGFYGERPSEELLLRSCQSAVFQGRFVIHSWRTDDTPTEPWTYPDALNTIRELIREHYLFMPYIYSTAYESTVTAVPIERMLVLEYPDDPALRPESIATQFGPSILKVLVVDEGEDEVSVRLPEKSAWYDVKRNHLYEGGRNVSVHVPLRKEAPYLVKVPSVVPVSPGLSTLTDGRYPRLCFRLYPGKDTCSYRYFEDDGQAVLSRKEYCVVDVSLSEGKVSFNVAEGVFPVRGRHVEALLPPGFKFLDGGGRSVSLDLSLGKAEFLFSGDYSS